MICPFPTLCHMLNTGILGWVRRMETWTNYCNAQFSWSLNNMCLNCKFTLRHGCFSMQLVHLVLRFCIPGFNQQYFQSTIEISWMWRHVCMHCFMHFYKGLEHLWVPYSHRCLGSGEVLEPNPLRYWEMTVVKFLGNQKSYLDFKLHGGWEP